MDTFFEGILIVAIVCIALGLLLVICDRIGRFFLWMSERTRKGVIGRRIS
jgi:hypothetical protein